MVVFLRMGSMVHRCLVVSVIGMVVICGLFFILVFPVVVLCRMLLNRRMMMLLVNWLMVVLHTCRRGNLWCHFKIKFRIKYR